jgi:phosphorylase/glycogen(starch) synthase
MVLNSGRYEFKNKGIDLFIDAIGELRNRESDRDLLAIIAVPAGITGPLPQLLSPTPGPINGNDRFITHVLNNPQYDPVIEWINKNGFQNDPGSNTHIIFIPSYLNGRDGLLNLEYYDFLMAFDYTIFPSYYEPWGYTPLESVAFMIPTITTQYAGFGKWVLENFSEKQDAVTVIERTYNEDKIVPKTIAKVINDYMLNGNREAVKKQALEISSEAEWSNLVNNYYNAWNVALLNSNERKSKVVRPSTDMGYEIQAPVQTNVPNWKKILVKNVFPDELLPLKELVNNIWWSWNDKATSLINSIGAGKDSIRNPIKRFENLTIDQMDEMVADKQFMKDLNEVYSEFKVYMGREIKEKDQRVAYFSMEFGLHATIKTYSGGLGVLAGDYLKQASDSNKDLFAVGLLYRFGYFKQEINISGDQIANYKAQKFTQMPITPVRDEDGKWFYINLALPGRVITAKIWKLMVGKVALYLMDTDIEQNKQEDRELTYHLYGGQSEHRLKQELLLGLGGIRLINKLNLKPNIYHSNEGHSAFIGIERIKYLIEEKHLVFKSALEVVRASNLFTTHTPVPAGHDTFNEDLVRAYLGHYPANYLGISWEEFIGLGKINSANKSEEFSMSILAMNLSRKINGVSKIHGEVSREMFQPLYPAYFKNEINVGHVTNGVHYPTWTDEVWKNTYKNLFGDRFENNQYDESLWEKIYEVDDYKIWSNRKKVKRKLIDEVMYRLDNRASFYHSNPKLILKTKANLTENTLIIGFARRFATYKRATLLFHDLDRLSKLMNKEDKPIVFLFAGKAHPRDIAGQNLIKHIIEISRQERFEGKILFLENYDMDLGKVLTSGVDVWLNTPTRPMEASGTSGEKAIMNGVLNLSVLDGWWAEGYVENAGWALEQKRRFEAQEIQDQLDAARLYLTFENEIIPAYFSYDKNGLPKQWIKYIKNNIAKICPRFTMQRMLDDYYNGFYNPLFSSSKSLQENDFKKANELSTWKEKVSLSWNEIKVENMFVPDPNRGPIEMEDPFIADINLNINGLDVDDLGIEVLLGNKQNDGSYKINQIEQLKPYKFENGIAGFRCNFTLNHAGVHDYAFRVYPKNELLSSRMDFPLTKWV